MKLIHCACRQCWDSLRALEKHWERIATGDRSEQPTRRSREEPNAEGRGEARRENPWALRDFIAVIGAKAEESSYAMCPIGGWNSFPQCLHWHGFECGRWK